MKRLAALIKFNPDATKEEIAQALNSIKHVLDLPVSTYEDESYVDPHGQRRVRMNSVPFRWRHLVQEYDDAHGEPVFYIP